MLQPMASDTLFRSSAHDYKYRQGDHICVTYETAAQQIAVAVEYVAEGLGRNERCLYAACSVEELDRFRQALNNRGIDARKAERAGSLLMLTKHAAHLQGGRFDSERMLRMLNEAVEAALNDGYIGLRTCGDMSWLLDEAPGSDQVMEYEAVLNEFFASVRGTGMCLYDRSRLPAALVTRAVQEHATVMVA